MFAVQLDERSITCHRLFPKRIDFVTLDFLSPFVESKRLFKPLRVHSKVIEDDSEYSESTSIRVQRQRYEHG